MPPPYRPLSQPHKPKYKNLSTTSNSSIAPSTTCFTPSTTFTPPPERFLHLKPPPSLPSLTCPPPYYISCESISCKMCTLLHFHPPHFCRLHTGIYPSSPPDLLPPCNSLPLSCLYSPEVPSPSILPSTLLVSSPTPA